MRDRFEVLDGWRGIAAIMVALFHLILGSHIFSIGVVNNGGHFVDFFFVLSGFVISYAYFDALRSNLSFGNFLIRRFGRLWPLHAAILALLVLRELAKLTLLQFHLLPSQPIFDGSSGTSMLQLLENIFFVQAIGIDTRHSWNGPSWSISTEFWTYIVFAGFCLLFQKRASIVAAALIALAGAACVAWYSPTYMNTSFEYGMARCLYGFFLGHLTCRLWSTSKAKLSYPHFTEVGALVLVVAYVSLTNLTPSNPWTLIAPLVFAAAVWVFAFEAGPISALMRNRAVLALGAWSYSIYMVHDFIAFVTIKFVKGCELASITEHGTALYRVTCLALLPSRSFAIFSDPWFLDIVTIVYLGVVIFVASLTYRYIEQPGRRYFNRLAESWLRPARQAAE